MKKTALKLAAAVACFTVVALLIELLLWIWFGAVVTIALALLAYRAGRLIEQLRSWRTGRPMRPAAARTWSWSTFCHI
jgi:hypothetical protein